MVCVIQVPLSRPDERKARQIAKWRSKWCLAPGPAPQCGTIFHSAEEAAPPSLSVNIFLATFEWRGRRRGRTRPHEAGRGGITMKLAGISASSPRGGRGAGSPWHHITRNSASTTYAGWFLPWKLKRCRNVHAAPLHALEAASTSRFSRHYY